MEVWTAPAGASVAAQGGCRPPQIDGVRGVQRLLKAGPTLAVGEASSEASSGGVPLAVEIVWRRLLGLVTEVCPPVKVADLRL
jgi:hypothetical protein